jgi:hypothetical protein
MYPPKLLKMFAILTLGSGDHPLNHFGPESFSVGFRHPGQKRHKTWLVNPAN